MDSAAAGCFGLLFKISFVLMAIYWNGGLAATTHTVGDGNGWKVDSNPNFYENWASQQTFVVGDSLLFDFSTGNHDVVQVPETSYGSCSQDGRIGDVITNGPATVPLNSAGTFYYICGVGSHCSMGQKLFVTVTANSSTAMPPTGRVPTPGAPPPAVAGGPTAACPPDVSPPGAAGGPGGSASPNQDSAAPSALGMGALATTMGLVALLFV